MVQSCSYLLFFFLFSLHIGNIFLYPVSLFHTISLPYHTPQYPGNNFCGETTSAASIPFSYSSSLLFLFSPSFLSLSTSIVSVFLVPMLVRMTWPHQNSCAYVCLLPAVSDTIAQCSLVDMHAGPCYEHRNVRVLRQEPLRLIGFIIPRMNIDFACISVCLCWWQKETNNVNLWTVS